MTSIPFDGTLGAIWDVVGVVRADNIVVGSAVWDSGGIDSNGGIIVSDGGIIVSDGGIIVSDGGFIVSDGGGPENGGIKLTCMKMLLLYRIVSYFS